MLRKNFLQMLLACVLIVSFSFSVLANFDYAAKSQEILLTSSPVQMVGMVKNQISSIGKENYTQEEMDSIEDMLINEYFSENSEIQRENGFEIQVKDYFKSKAFNDFTTNYIYLIAEIQKFYELDSKVQLKTYLSKKQSVQKKYNNLKKQFKAITDDFYNKIAKDYKAFYLQVLTNNLETLAIQKGYTKENFAPIKADLYKGLQAIDLETNETFKDSLPIFINAYKNNFSEIDNFLDKNYALSYNKKIENLYSKINVALQIKDINGDDYVFLNNKKISKTIKLNFGFVGNRLWYESLEKPYEFHYILDGTNLGKGHIFEANENSYGFYPTEDTFIYNGKTYLNVAFASFDDKHLVIGRKESDGGYHLFYDGKDIGTGGSPMLSDGNFIYRNNDDEVFFNQKKVGKGEFLRISGNNYAFLNDKKEWIVNGKSVGAGEQLEISGNNYAFIRDQDKHLIFNGKDLGIADSPVLSGKNIAYLKAAFGPDNTIVMFNEKNMGTGDNASVLDNHIAFMRNGYVYVDGMNLGKAEQIEMGRK